MNPKAKTALITGASSGIGKELAENFARGGYTTILTARREKELQELASRLASEYGTGVTVIPADLSTTEGPAELYRSVKQEGIAIDILVNNAGLGHFCAFNEYGLVQDLAMLRLNIDAVVILTKLFLPDLIANRGNLVNVASTAAFQPGPYLAVYSATKAFVLSFSEALSCELEESGVTVTAFCPGPTASEFIDCAGMHSSAMVKGKELPTPREVAAAGFKAIQDGKSVYIHGTGNWVRAQSVRLAPRKMVTRIARSVIGPVER